MNKNTIIIFSLVAILVIGAAGYFGFATTQVPEPTPTIPQTVSVTSCDVEQTVTAPGNLAIVNEAIISMPTIGRLTTVNVRVGDRVQAGQVLAELDLVTATQAHVDVLEAQEALETLQKRRSALDYPRASKAYIKELRDQIYFASRSVDELESAYKSEGSLSRKAQIFTSLTSAKQELRNMQGTLNWYTGKPTEDDIAAVDTELALAQANYDVAKALLESLQIKEIGRASCRERVYTSV